MHLEFSLISASLFFQTYFLLIKIPVCACAAYIHSIHSCFSQITRFIQGRLGKGFILNYGQDKSRISKKRPTGRMQPFRPSYLARRDFLSTDNVSLVKRKLINYYELYKEKQHPCCISFLYRPRLCPQPPSAV